MLLAEAIALREGLLAVKHYHYSRVIIEIRDSKNLLILLQETMKSLGG